MAASELAAHVGVAPACRSLGVSRATYYRRQSPPAPRQPRPTPPRALTAPERQEVLAVLDSPRFVDSAPATVRAALLDEGRYLCSERTMYRLMHARAPLRERRNQLQHPNYAKPELVATAPNQVWSWDITKLLGPKKWTYYYLYVLLDSCGASSNVQSRPRGRVRARLAPPGLHISAPDQRASSHVRIEASERHAATAGSSTPTGPACASAARLVSRSTVA